MRRASYASRVGLSGLPAVGLPSRSKSTHLRTLEPRNSLTLCGSAQTARPLGVLRLASRRSLHVLLSDRCPLLLTIRSVQLITNAVNFVPSAPGHNLVRQRLNTIPMLNPLRRPRARVRYTPVAF